MIERDLRRWQKADSDSDNKLNKQEFQAFIHPEDVEHMRDILCSTRNFRRYGY